MHTWRIQRFRRVSPRLGNGSKQRNIRRRVTGFLVFGYLRSHHFRLCIDILLCDVRIYHRRLQLLMAQQFLYGSYVISLFQQMRRKAVPKGMHRYMLCDVCFLDRGLERSLHCSGVDMMPPHRVRAWIDRAPPARPHR